MKIFRIFVFAFTILLSFNGFAETDKIHVVVFNADGTLREPTSVVLTCGEKEETKTTANGAVWFQGIPGQCEITISDTEKRQSKTFVLSNDEVEILVTVGASIEIAIEGGVPVKEVTKVEKKVLANGTLLIRVQALDSQKKIVGAKIFVRGTDLEETTNAKGEASLSLPPGGVDVSVVHPDFSSQSVQDLSIVSEKVIERVVSLTPVSVALEDFTVTAPRIEGSARDTLAERRKSNKVAEVLGADEMKKNGSSNAADALSRVTGITVVGGKFVYVRGLGDRYSMTLMGNANLPSPEPEKRVVPLDLFPADMLASVLVQKSYTADMPGAFGGGTVVLRTQDVPKLFEAKLGISLGGNTETTFREGLSSATGDFDFLGFDDGTRSLPDEVQDASQRSPLKEGDRFGNGGYTADELESYGESLSNSWKLDSRTLPPNLGLNASIGVPFDFLGGQSGFRLGFVYDNDWKKVQREQNYYVVSSGGKLEASNKYVFDETVHNIVLGGIFTTGWNYKDLHKIKLTTILDRVSDGEDRQYSGFNRDVDAQIRVTRFRWLERQLFFQQIEGEHQIIEDATRLDWNYAFSQAARSEPDRRETRYDKRPSGPFQLSDRPEGNSRVFSSLTDNAHSGQVSLEQIFNISGIKLDSQAGLSAMAKNREVDTRRYKYFGDTTDPLLFQQSPEVIFSPDQIGDSLRFTEITRPTDNYRASHYIGAAFLKTDLLFSEILNATLGVRFEHSDQSVETFELFSVNQNEVSANLTTSDFMPHLGVNWSPTKEVIVRASASRNVSRPDFRELSPQLFNDVTGGLAVQGNPDLNRATIIHSDLRLEWYFSESEFASIGGFYKGFNEPIESVLVPGAQQLKTFANAESATNIGFELEVRTGFGFVSEALRDFNFSANLGLIYSRVSIDPDAGIQTSSERALQGQSPYVANAQLGYTNADLGTQVSVLFNLVGPRISEVGALGAPDIFEVPGAGLDVVVKQSLGAGLSLGAKLKNGLNAKTVFEQGDFETSSYRKGIGFSLSLSKSF